MKTKNILIIILVALLSFNIGYFLSRSTLYPETGIITEVIKTDVDTYEVVFEVANGNMFSFYTDDYDLYVGEIISVLMDNNGTEIVYNDKIIDYKYSGTIEMFGGIKNEN